MGSPLSVRPLRLSPFHRAPLAYVVELDSARCPSLPLVFSSRPSPGFIGPGIHTTTTPSDFSWRFALAFPFWGYTAATYARLNQDPMRSPSIIYVAVPLHPNSNHARVSQVAKLGTRPLILLAEQTSPSAGRVVSTRTPPLVRRTSGWSFAAGPSDSRSPGTPCHPRLPACGLLLRLQSPSTSLGTGET